MVGGDETAFAALEPALATLAPESGYAHVGPAGAGHFVKMVHNGIEYGLMQALCRGLRAAGGDRRYDLDLGRSRELWHHGCVVRSWLLELLRARLRRRPGPRADQAATWRTPAKAAGRCTRRSRRTCPLPAISAALYARFRSRQDDTFAAKVIAALRNQFGGHAVESADERRGGEPAA